MIAYHNDPALKDRLLAEMAAHREAERLTQGIYWNGAKGCAVGCLLQDPTGAHLRYETEFGIPAQLAYLEDRIFERLPFSEAKKWPERFLAAIPVGADLSLVWPRFALWLLCDPDHGVRRLIQEPSVIRAIDDVVALCERRIGGEGITKLEWQQAAINARGAAADAADATAYAAADTARAAVRATADAAAAAAAAADSAADATADAAVAAADAADDAADAADDAAARAAYAAQADKLVELLSAADAEVAA